MKRHRKYLFLSSGHEGQGRMFTINALGFSLFVITLVGMAGVGVWALVAGVFFSESYHYKSANLRSTQTQIMSHVTEIETKQRIVQKKMTLLKSELRSAVPSFTITAPETPFFKKKLQGLSLDSMVVLSNSLVKTVEELALSTSEDGSVWSAVPIMFPIQRGAMWLFKRPFGVVLDPFSGLEKMHNGIDISAQKGTAVVASARGKIIKIQKSHFWGNKITIRHAYGFSTVYAHLATVQVKRGSIIQKGTVIGTVGETGWSTSPLVHFEMRREGEPFDPTILLRYFSRT